MNRIEAARQEYQDWCESLGIDKVEKLNQILSDGMGIKLVNLCEARQERKYASAADQILWSRQEKPIVMMSGPSSSGKTSSSLRIAQQCLAMGVYPQVIELDNYFVDRERTPKDKNGNYDFECLEAMDIELLNSNLNDLLDGKEVVIPKFDFIQGKQIFDESRKMRLEPGSMLFMEGIHALNPAMTPSVDRSRIFNVYIAPLSALMLGETEFGSTTDKRLLRRIVRDNRTRGISPVDNIMRWQSVRDGEVKNIFPYADNADVVFNSSMLYDMPMLRYFAEPLLYEIAETSPAYGTACRLLEYCNHFLAMKPEEIAAIPLTSIMREFIGGQKLV